MTRPFLITLVLAVGQSRLLAAALNLAGEPFHPGQAEVVWSVRSNDYPPALWVYRVIPHHFAPPIVSNLMAIGNFAMKDRRRPDRQGRLKDKEALYFADNDKTRYLGIYPSQGFIDYYDSKARADMKAPIEGVPTESEALRLALNLLQQLGVDRSQLATKPGSCELRAYQTEGRRGRLDKARGEIAREIDSRGVYFVRRVDGADFTGLGSAGGFCVDFGNHARVIQLTLVWRNLEPFQPCAISPETIVSHITRGLAVKASPPPIDPRMIRKLEVYRLTLAYLGEVGEEPQAFVYPFAGLEVRADMGDTNLAFQLSCPIAE